MARQTFNLLVVAICAFALFTFSVTFLHVLSESETTQDIIKTHVHSRGLIRTLEKDLMQARRERYEAQTTLDKELSSLDDTVAEALKGSMRDHQSLDLEELTEEELRQEKALKDLETKLGNHEDKLKDAMQKETGNNIETTTSDDDKNGSNDYGDDDQGELQSQATESENHRSISPSSMDAYLQEHNGFPIVLLCYNRAEILAKTLDSLLAVRGVKREQILVSQDGAIASVTHTIQRYSVLSIQRPEGLKIKVVEGRTKKIDGGMRIADHYKYSLEHAFEYFPDAPGIVIVEDDFLFSPDFMEFFVAVAPAIEKDDSLWIASAWNDNGFRGVVRDRSNLLRTDHFPGLGWLLLRPIWEEIREKWPVSHWDWFMRDPNTSKGRDTVYPEVPRDFHTGSKGTFMDINTHRQYFDTIDYNLDESFRWPADTAWKAMKENYEARFLNLLQNGKIASTSEDFTISTGDPEKALVVWYNADPHPTKESRVKQAARKLGIWHQIMRGARHGVHEIWFMKQKLVLVNVFDPTGFTANELKERKSDWFHGADAQTEWARYKPADAKVWGDMELGKELPQNQFVSSLFSSPHFAGLSQDADDGNDNVSMEDWRRRRKAMSEHNLSSRQEQVHARAQLLEQREETRKTTEEDDLVSMVATRGYAIVGATMVQVGVSCDVVCQSAKMECAEKYLPAINNCESLQSRFRCSTCEDSVGGDQPAFADNQKCLINNDPSYFSCHGRYDRSRRLCPCTSRQPLTSSAF